MMQCHELQLSTMPWQDDMQRLVMDFRTELGQLVQRVCDDIIAQARQAFQQSTAYRDVDIVTNVDVAMHSKRKRLKDGKKTVQKRKKSQAKTCAIAETNQSPKDKHKKAKTNTRRARSQTANSSRSESAQSAGKNHLGSNTSREDGTDSIHRQASQGSDIRQLAGGVAQDQEALTR